MTSLHRSLSVRSVAALCVGFSILLSCFQSASFAAEAAGADAKESTGGKETKQEHDARMAWWRDAKFGMFIHWGVYSVPAGFYQDKPVKGIGEWIMNNA